MFDISSAMKTPYQVVLFDPFNGKDTFSAIPLKRNTAKFTTYVILCLVEEECHKCR